MPTHASDKTHLRIEGHDSDRVLIIGDGPAVGWGVDSQDDGLLGTLARELSALSGRGANVDLVADPFMTAERAVSHLQELLIWRYDYVFIVLGISDAAKLTPVSSWRHSMATLLAAVTAEVAVSAHVVVASVPPISSIKQITWPFSTIVVRRADALDAATVELCASLPRVKYVEIPATNVAAMKNGYEIVATQLAGVLSRVLDDEQHLASSSRRPKDEDPTSIGEGDVFTRVAGLVQRSFMIKDVSVTVVEGNRQLRIDQAGARLEETPGDNVLRAFSPPSTDMMIVGDTRYDKRFNQDPAVLGDRRIRFYASFPIESPDGELVAALCITDTAPRRRSREIDVVALRHLAQLALRELWQYLPPQLELQGPGLL